jgi:outer membrane protein assembly factor BamD (BamD/ComL family)
MIPTKLSSTLTQFLYRRLCALMLAGLLLLPAQGCNGSDAESLYEIAQLEEQQNNRVHARELYEQIIEEFPKSDYAARARECLTALESSQ